MKEFTSQTGGRYTYVDDILNLQNLALAFTQIFDDCDNFIVSGCEVSGTSISSGLVYINGKLREFAGKSNIAQWPQYIYEVNRNENVPYVSTGQQVGRTIFGCEIGNTVPTTIDNIANSTPGYIQINATGGLRIKDAFFGKYCVLLDPKATSQTVKNLVTFQNGIKSSGKIQANAVEMQKSEENFIQIVHEDTQFVINCNLPSGRCRMVVNSSGEFTMNINGVRVLTIADSQLDIQKAAKVPQLIVDNIIVDDTYLYNSGTASDSGALWINLNGYNNTSSYYRDTYIGNGKGSVLMQFKGADNNIVSGCPIISNLAAASAIILKSTYSRTDVSLRKTLVWQDKNSVEIGYIGYDSIADSALRLKNTIGAIEIIANDSVNIVAPIKENGVLLTAKYVLKTDFNTAIDNKADATKVYSKSSADLLFARIDSGLKQFIDATHNASQLCSEIGAIQSSALSNYVQKSQYLSDMAVTDADKKTIRDNIGAASAEDVPATKDSGWVKIGNPNGNELYIRQIGKIVCIQGKVKTIHSGRVFAIPASIDAPAYTITGTYGTNYNQVWGVTIAGKQKGCVVSVCNGSCGKTIEFSMTYMTE